MRVRTVQTRNGVRLEIVAPRLGCGIRLCPLELETLTWQSHDVFSEFLRTPFGPEDEARTDVRQDVADRILRTTRANPIVSVPPGASSRPRAASIHARTSGASSSSGCSRAQRSPLRTSVHS